MHRYRMSFSAGFALGFVLGTRAGRERYEQMKKLARSVAENPAVQQAAGALQARATDALRGAAGKLNNKVHERVPKMAHGVRNRFGEHVPGMRHRHGGAANGDPAGADPDERFGSRPFATAKGRGGAS
jgi:hypothetical protein